MDADRRSLLLDDESAQKRQRNRVKLTEYEHNGLRVKGHFFTLIGFVLGFLMALATLLFYDRFLLLSEQMERHTTATEYYQTGYMMALQEVATEQHSLAHKLEAEVRILCLVLTAPKYHQSRAAHARATWGKRCTKLIFASSERDDELGAEAFVEESIETYDDLWNKTREGFRHVYEQHFNDYDWFLKADDDTYVVMENLRYMLYSYSPETPIYFGYKMVRYDVEYMSGGASYVLSKEALRRFMTQSFHNESLCPRAHRYGIEDYYMGICLQNVGVLVADSRHALATDEKSKFIPLNLEAYMTPDTNITIPDWLIGMTPYKVVQGLSCCSNYSVAFHYVDPASMYLYEYLIYHLQAVGLRAHATKLPAKITTAEVMAKFPIKFNGTPVVDLYSVTLPDNF